MPRQKAEGGSSVHTTLRIPRELHERLASAAGKDRNIGDEIRQRLELSFQRSHDPKTRELCAAVASMADMVGSYSYSWHANPFSFRVLKLMLGKLTAYYEKEVPKEQTVPKMKPDGLAYVLWDESVTPEEVANVIAGPEILRLHEGRLQR